MSCNITFEEEEEMERLLALSDEEFDAQIAEWEALAFPSPRKEDEAPPETNRPFEDDRETETASAIP